VQGSVYLLWWLARIDRERGLRKGCDRGEKAMEARAVSIYSLEDGIRDRMATITGERGLQAVAYRIMGEQDPMGQRQVSRPQVSKINGHD